MVLLNTNIYVHTYADNTVELQVSVVEYFRDIHDSSSFTILCTVNDETFEGENFAFMVFADFQ